MDVVEFFSCCKWKCNSPGVEYKGWVQQRTAAAAAAGSGRVAAHRPPPTAALHRDTAPLR